MEAKIESTERLRREGRWEEAERELRRQIKLARRYGERRQESQGTGNLGLCLTMAGRLGDARKLLERYSLFCNELAYRRSTVVAAIAQAQLEFFSGNLVLAHEHAEEARRRALEAHAPQLVAAGHHLLGRVHLAEGRANDAVTSFLESTAAYRSIGDRVENIRRLHEIGLQVFILDYRGYGLSEGSPSEQGLYEDAQAAYAHLLSRDDVDPERIAIFGRSLGGAVAVDLASRVPCRRLILESTFSSAADMAGHILPILPLGRLMTERFDSASKMDKIRAPLLQFHGTQDEIVPYRLGEKLHQSAREPKEFVPIPGATHNDTYFVGGRAYFEKIRSFLH